VPHHYYNCFKNHFNFLHLVVNFLSSYIHIYLSCFLIMFTADPWQNYHAREFLKLSTRARRKHYKCRDKYVTVKDIEKFSDQAQMNYGKRKRQEGEINCDCCYFFFSSKSLLSILYAYKLSRSETFFSRKSLFSKIQSDSRKFMITKKKIMTTRKRVKV